MRVVLPPRVEIDGDTASLEQIWRLDRSTTGHFTAMQVRGRRALGLDLHLDRLVAATLELFGVELDAGRIRDLIRHALAEDVADASVRVNVFPSDADGDVSVAVSVRPPASAPPDPQGLQTVEYQRPLPHIKHATGFGQSYFAGLAHGNGFDEALFITRDGVVCEGSVTNLGLVAGDAIVWPDAPALRGIMMQVLQRELDRDGRPWRSEIVRVADLGSFDGAFVTNSHGMAAVSRIDDRALPADSEPIRTARRLLADALADPI